MNKENAEMIANARAAYRAQDITLWDLWTVYFIVARAQAERAVLA